MYQYLQSRHASRMLEADLFSRAVEGTLRMQETYDLDAPLDETAKKLIDAAGAGQSNMSPGWLTELGRLWGGTSVSWLPCNVYRKAFTGAIDARPMAGECVHKACRRGLQVRRSMTRLTPHAGRAGGGRQAGGDQGAAGRRAVQGAVQVDGRLRPGVPAADRSAGLLQSWQRRLLPGAPAACIRSCACKTRAAAGKCGKCSSESEGNPARYGLQAPPPASWSSPTQQPPSTCCGPQTTPSGRSTTRVWSLRCRSMLSWHCSAQGLLHEPECMQCSYCLVVGNLSDDSTCAQQTLQVSACTLEVSA